MVDMRDIRKSHYIAFPSNNEHAKEQQQVEWEGWSYAQPTAPKYIFNINNQVSNLDYDPSYLGGSGTRTDTDGVGLVADTGWDILGTLIGYIYCCIAVCD